MGMGRMEYYGREGQGGGGSMFLGVSANRIRDDLGGGDKQGAVPCLLPWLPATSPLLPGGPWQGAAPGVRPGHGARATGCRRGRKVGDTGPPGQQS